MALSNIFTSHNPQEIKIAFNTYTIDHLESGPSAVSLGTIDKPAELVPYLNGHGVQYPANVRRSLSFGVYAASPNNTILDYLQKYQRLATSGVQLPAALSAVFDTAISDIVFTMEYGEIAVATRAWTIENVGDVSIPTDGGSTLVRRWDMVFADEISDVIGALGTVR